MTAEERREPMGSMDVAAYKRGQAKRAAIESVVRQINHSDEVAIRSIACLAYEAGRSSMQEEAAQKTDSLAGECTAINDLHGHECEIDCEAVKELAAAIRALKP